MELWEAIKLLQEGKKIRCKSWSSCEYICFNDNGVIIEEDGEPLIDVKGVIFSHPEEACWEEYKEGWQNVEVQNIWDLPTGVADMALVSVANCPYCDKKVVTLRILGDCKYCPYCGKQVIK